MKISEVMTTDVATASVDTTLEEIATMMRAENVGAIPILDEDEELAGIVTDRDIVIRCIADGKDATEATAEDILSYRVDSISPDQNVEAAARLMASKQIRRLPVVENGKLVGIISIGDLAVKTNEDKLLSHTLEDVSRGVKQSSRGAREGAHPPHEESSQYAQTQDREAASAQRGASRAGRATGRLSSKDQKDYGRREKNQEQTTHDLNRRSNGQEKEGSTRRVRSEEAQPQSLRSESSSRKQGIGNRSATEENRRNDKVVPFREDNRTRNTRVQKPSAGMKKPSAAVGKGSAKPKKMGSRKRAG